MRGLLQGRSAIPGRPEIERPGIDPAHEQVPGGLAIAAATGQAAALDPEAASVLLPAVLALGGQLQATGMYQAPKDVLVRAAARPSRSSAR